MPCFIRARLRSHAKAFPSVVVRLTGRISKCEAQVRSANYNESVKLIVQTSSCVYLWKCFMTLYCFCFFSFNLSTSVPSVTRKKTSGYGLKVLILRNTGERHSQHAQRKLDKICKESTLTKCVQAQLRPVAV